MVSNRKTPFIGDRRRDPDLTREGQRRQRIALGLIGFSLLVVMGIIVAGYVIIFVVTVIHYYC